MSRQVRSGNRLFACVERGGDLTSGEGTAGTVGPAEAARVPLTVPAPPQRHCWNCSLPVRTGGAANQLWKTTENVLSVCFHLRDYSYTKLFSGGLVRGCSSNHGLGIFPFSTVTLSAVCNGHPVALWSSLLLKTECTPHSLPRVFEDFGIPCS